MGPGRSGASLDSASPCGAPCARSDRLGPVCQIDRRNYHAPRAAPAASAASARSRRQGPGTSACHRRRIRVVDAGVVRLGRIVAGLEGRLSVVHAVVHTDGHGVFGVACLGQAQGPGRQRAVGQIVQHDLQHLGLGHEGGLSEGRRELAEGAAPVVHAELEAFLVGSRDANLQRRGIRCHGIHLSCFDPRGVVAVDDVQVLPGGRRHERLVAGLDRLDHEVQEDAGRLGTDGTAVPALLGGVEEVRDGAVVERPRREAVGASAPERLVTALDAVERADPHRLRGVRVCIQDARDGQRGEAKLEVPPGSRLRGVKAVKDNDGPRVLDNSERALVEQRTCQRILAGARGLPRPVAARHRSKGIVDVDSNRCVLGPECRGNAIFVHTRVGPGRRVPADEACGGVGLICRGAGERNTTAFDDVSSAVRITLRPRAHASVRRIHTKERRDAASWRTGTAREGREHHHPRIGRRVDGLVVACNQGEEVDDLEAEGRHHQDRRGHGDDWVVHSLDRNADGPLRTDRRVAWPAFLDHVAQSNVRCRVLLGSNPDAVVAADALYCGTLAQQGCGKGGEDLPSLARHRGQPHGERTTRSVVANARQRTVLRAPMLVEIVGRQKNPREVLDRRRNLKCVHQSVSSNRVHVLEGHAVLQDRHRHVLRYRDTVLESHFVLRHGPCEVEL
eukprot:scaffold977_cov253-Pinguiococcus_pyrenoidosus.AAC.3